MGKVVYLWLALKKIKYVSPRVQLRFAHLFLNVRSISVQRLLTESINFVMLDLGTKLKKFF